MLKLYLVCAIPIAIACFQLYYIFFKGVRPKANVASKTFFGVATLGLVLVAVFNPFVIFLAHASDHSDNWFGSAYLLLFLFLLSIIVVAISELICYSPAVLSAAPNQVQHNAAAPLGQSNLWFSCPCARRYA